MMKEFVGGMVQDVSQEAKRPKLLTVKKSTDNLHDQSSKLKEGKHSRNIFKKKDKPPQLVSPSRELPVDPVSMALHGNLTDFV
jgi:hypothetical protein